MLFLKESAFRIVIQCCNVAEAQPKQFPSLCGVTDKQPIERSVSGEGVRGVVGVLLGAD